ncbi:MAG: type III-A CRISPR-associated RAMP protein Csm3 [Pyrobaculum sp.]|nr:type III-A CRISPR-associated RAMP protein Csm3 [Pyrobaculum sp.]
MSLGSTQLELVGIVDIRFKLETYGLLIRSGRAKEILGAADVVPMTISRAYTVQNVTRTIEVPYIPASSLKGKTRSLLEIAYNLPLYTTDNKIYLHMRVVKDDVVHEDPYCPIDNIFGTPAIDEERLKKKGLQNLFKCWAPSRAIFRDLFPSVEYIKGLCEEKGCSDITLGDFVEEKWENRIDRVTSTADPRNVLRLKPGVEFDGSIAFLIFDLDICIREECNQLLSAYRDIIGDSPPAKFYIQTLLKGLELVEETYLGASGTRGYGQVKFKMLKAEFKPIAPRAKGVAPPAVEGDDLAKFITNVQNWDLWNGLKGLCKS